MGPMRILLLRPDSEEPSPVDQTLGVRLAADAFGSDILLEEAPFRAADFSDLQRVFDQCCGGAAAVIGATSVPESTRLGELAEAKGLLCFVANNNPAVWQKRRAVFHIGLPSSQTAEAVAAHLQRRGCQRVALIHDSTDFQRRVAANMESAFAARAIAARSHEQLSGADLARLSDWNPNVIYVVFSNEAAALRVVQEIRARGFTAPLLFGRSLLRQSFLSTLGNNAGASWFVDMFSRVSPTATAAKMFAALRGAAVNVPTANHAFGWDGLTFCIGALRAAAADPSGAIAYLESGAQLQGVTGACSFSPDNHNGRSGSGPTVLTRWESERFADV